MSALDYILLALIAGYCLHLIFRKKKTRGCCGDCAKCTVCKFNEDTK